MQASQQFLHRDMSFWANVRTITEQIGYSSGKRLHVPDSIDDVCDALHGLGLASDHLHDGQTSTALGTDILSYLQYRATSIEIDVFPMLMDSPEAKNAFEDLKSRNPQSYCHIPRNNQQLAQGESSFLTGIVNLIIETNCQGLPCDYNPQTLTSITQDRKPFRTLARRVDGAFLSTVNPIAIWEIKEYYHTTSFGSRVADGVYVSMLDGIEIKEVQDSRVHLDPNSRKVHHLLMVDGRGTWQGHSGGPAYLCRIIDMLHMGYVDEVLFGREVLSQLPKIVSDWVKLASIDSERLESALRTSHQRIDKLLKQVNVDSYTKVVPVLIGIRALQTTLKRANEWDCYIAQIRSNHSKKLKLLNILSESGL